MLPGPESRHVPPSRGVPRANRERMSGWEIADTGVDVAGSVVRGIGWLVLKAYALLLIAAGIAVMVFLDDLAGKGGGLLIAGYGTYLLLGGSWVIY